MSSCAIVEVLVEAEARVVAGLLHLQLFEGHREQPRLELLQHLAGGTEIGERLVDQRERRRRDELVERLIGTQHPLRQERHLRARREELGHVELFDEQIRILVGCFERGRERVVGGREHMHRPGEVDHAAALARHLPQEAPRRCRRGRRQAAGDGEREQN